MARITSGVTCSHVPALGVASDTNISDDDYYGPIFAGFEYSKDWIAKEKPDLIFLVWMDSYKLVSLRKVLAVIFVGGLTAVAAMQ